MSFDWDRRSEYEGKGDSANHCTALCMPEMNDFCNRTWLKPDIAPIIQRTRKCVTGKCVGVSGGLRRKGWGENEAANPPISPEISQPALPGHTSCDSSESVSSSDGTVTRPLTCKLERVARAVMWVMRWTNKAGVQCMLGQKVCTKYYDSCHRILTSGAAAPERNNSTHHNGDDASCPGGAREHASSTRLLKDTGCQRGGPRTGSVWCPSPEEEGSVSCTLRRRKPGKRVTLQTTSTSGVDQLTSASDRSLEPLAMEMRGKQPSHSPRPCTLKEKECVNG
ncbi:unnamed protein product [Pleuronectes platessa]|uniref:Uncharacterized protein n=1 Tax=Pleuronectes platessa TaxID=8262 RepID=A0A9N7YW92_PLEPL|nr:unnamed protein product [Pleuronectes platessa]